MQVLGVWGQHLLWLQQQEWVLSEVEAEGGAPGQLSLQGLVERPHLRVEGGAACREEGRYSRWQMEGSNDRDHQWVLLISVVGKIKIADLSLGRLIPKVGVRFCLGSLVFIGLDDPKFFFFVCLSSLWFTQDSFLNLPSLTVSGSHKGEWLWSAACSVLSLRSSLSSSTCRISCHRHRSSLLLLLVTSGEGPRSLIPSFAQGTVSKWSRTQPQDKPALAVPWLCPLPAE